MADEQPRDDEYREHEGKPHETHHPPDDEDDQKHGNNSAEYPHEIFGNRYGHTMLIPFRER